MKHKCASIIRRKCRYKYFTICKAKYDAFIRSKCFAVSRSKLYSQCWSYKHAIKSTIRRTHLASIILSKQYTHTFATIGTIKGAIWGNQLISIIQPKCYSIIKPKCDSIINPRCRAKYFTICSANYYAFIIYKCFSVIRSKLYSQCWSYKHAIKSTIRRAHLTSIVLSKWITRK